MHDNTAHFLLASGEGGCSEGLMGADMSGEAGWLYLLLYGMTAQYLLAQGRGLEGRGGTGGYQT